MKRKPITIWLLLFLFTLLGSAIAQTNDRTRFFPTEELKPDELPDKQKVWVFMLAGQSNMAGRGRVEPQDTIPNDRILTVNKNGELIIAKEPLHFYEPTMNGLDCGVSFARELLPNIPDNTSILLIPTAVGGSSILQWLNDSTFREVPLMTNFIEKLAIGKAHGTVKGILWHQGENDASTEEGISLYRGRLKRLFGSFRQETGNASLPIMMGELAVFSKNNENWQRINEEIKAYHATDENTAVIETGDLEDKGDTIHFDSEGQRTMGKRFARAYIELTKSPEADE